jgi:hypothetical protein
MLALDKLNIRINPGDTWEFDGCRSQLDFREEILIQYAIVSDRRSMKLPFTPENAGVAGEIIASEETGRLFLKTKSGASITRSAVDIFISLYFTLQFDIIANYIFLTISYRNSL